MTDIKMIDFLSILFIIIFIGLVMVLLGLMRAITQRSAFLKEMKVIQNSMRDLLTGMHVLRINLRQNQILKREPFLSRVKTLDIELCWLESEFNHLRDQYVLVQEKIDRWEKMDRLNYIATLLPWSDYNQLIPASKLFAPEMVVLNDYLAKAILHTQEISELGWEVASRIKESLEKRNDCSRVLLALCEKNVHGIYIEETKLTIEQVNQKLESIPQELLSNTKDEIINQTEYATICKAYDVYQEILPIIDNLHTHLYQWWNDFQQAARTINSAQSALANTSGLIKETSEKIALGNLSENLKTIQSIGDILGDTLNRVEIDSLASMSQEAERIYQLALETADIVKMARRNQTILEPLLEQIETGIVQLQTQINSLGNHATLPLAWDKSGSRFFSIKERQKEIVVEERLRSPDEIQNHLALALSIYKDVTELTTQIKQLTLSHEMMVKTYQTDEINQGLYWSQEARRIIESAGVYNEANFPKNLSIKFLSSELESIQQRHQSLINDLFSNPFLESSVPELLGEMRELFDAYSVLREQVAEVKSYLNIFREDVNQTRETLQKIQPLLNQMESIARSNPLLLQQGAENEIERLRKNLDTCISKVNDLSVGTIRDKQMAVTTIDQRVEKTCLRWIKYLEKKIDTISADLRERIKKLGEMANLDDAIIMQARDLLSQSSKEAGNTNGTIDKVTIYENPVLSLKAKNDLWQNLLAVSGEIDEMIYNPISEAYQAVLTQKELAMKQLLTAVQIIPEKRIWPATSITLPEISANLSSIDAVWNKNITQPMRAIWWVKRFGEIWIKYQEFTHSVNIAVETCKNEREAIIALEQQLDFIDQKWSSMEQQMGDNHIAITKIRALKKYIEQQYKHIRRRWQFSGGMPGMGPDYEEVKKFLEGLVDRFQASVVTIDDGSGITTEIGVFGTHTKITENPIPEENT